MEKAGPIAVMGGAVNNPGNVTTHAEFNFYSDPQAADMVVSSGIPMVLVDLGASRQAALSRHQVQSLTGGNPFGKLAIRLLQAWFRLDDSRDQFQFYDPLAMAAVIEPSVVSGIQLTLGVETRDQKHLGKSRVVSQGGNIHVAERVDRVLFFSLLKRLFAWEVIDPANLS